MGSANRAGNTSVDVDGGDPLLNRCAFPYIPLVKPRTKFLIGGAFVTDNVDVVVEGRLDRDGTFRATTLLATCASRYDSAVLATLS